MLLENTKPIELKKHISVIHCSNNLSLLQRKISNVLLFHAYPLLKTQEEHKISINELCVYLKYHSYNYDALKQALKALISTVIEWNVFGDNTQDEDWTASSILASVNIKKTVCTYAYSPRMKQLLYSPIMYGRVNLTIQSKFTSNYGLALYENCSRYRKLKKTKTFSLDQFRKIMGVTSGKYLIFRDFKKRVINKAVEEVNKLSDLVVEANIVKIGQQVTSIYFNISEKKNNNFLSNRKSIIYDNQEKNKFIEETKLQCQSVVLVKKLKENYCLREQTIKDLIQKYGLHRLESKAKQIESTQTFISGRILNAAGFLIDALKKDYIPSKSICIITKEERIAREKEIYEVKQLKLKQEKSRTNYNLYIDKQLSDFINEINNDYLDKLLNQFENYLENKKYSLIVTKFKKVGLTSRIVRIFFRIFLQENISECASKFITFEQFVGENK